MDFDYIGKCMYEILRLDPPVPMTTLASMMQDVKIKNINFGPDTPFWINTRAIHYDPKQWKEPSKFVPERFDSQSDWFKRPDGGQRNPLTFSPFLGGRRICIGKTFAEVTIRFTIPILLHHLQYEFLNKDQLINKPSFNI